MTALARTLGLFCTVGLAVVPSCTCGETGVVADASLADVQADEPLVDSNPTFDVAPSDGALSECEHAAADHSVVGCEYWTFSPHHQDEFGCGAVLLSNVSTTDAQVSVKYKSAALNVVNFMRLVQGSGKSVSYVQPKTPTIPAGTTALLSLFQGNPFNEHECDCPSPAAVSNVMVPAPGVGDGFHITSSVPVAAVFDHPYACTVDHTEGATVLRSVGNWDTRYRDTGAFQPGRPSTQRDFGASTITTDPTWTAAIASTTLTATFATDGGPAAFKLIRGNVVTLEQDDYHIGSLVTATSPIALWTGANTEIPFNFPSVDATYLQMPPIADWATEYAAVPFPSRYAPTDKGSIWRIVADADGTNFTYDPSPPTGAPSKLNAGQLAVFRSTDPFVVRSQEPAHVFSLTQLMSSCSDAADDADAAVVYGQDGGEVVGCPGDPEIQSAPAAWEYAHHMVFVTNPAYPTTKLVIVRHRDDGGYHDVTLDCAGTLGGWVPIGSSTYEYAYVTLSDANFIAQSVGIGLCDNGNHVADSVGAFSIAVWQWGTYLANNAQTFTFYDNVSVGYTVPGVSVSPRGQADGGVH